MKISPEVIKTMLETGNPHPFFDDVNACVRATYPFANRAELKKISDHIKSVGIQIRNVGSEMIRKARRGEQREF